MQVKLQPDHPHCCSLFSFLFCDTRRMNKQFEGGYLFIFKAISLHKPIHSPNEIIIWHSFIVLMPPVQTTGVVHSAYTCWYPAVSLDNLTIASSWDFQFGQSSTKNLSFQVAASLDRMALTSKGVTSFLAVLKSHILVLSLDVLFVSLSVTSRFHCSHSPRFWAICIYEYYFMPPSRSLRNIWNSIGLGDDYCKSPWKPDIRWLAVGNYVLKHIT